MVRAITTCPVRDCRVQIVNLPRHLREVHHWKDEESKKAKQLYGLRKSYEITNPYPKRPNLCGVSKYRATKACPVWGCRSMGKNVSRHIKTVHKINDKSDKYKNLMANVVKVDLTRTKSKTGPPLEDEKGSRDVEHSKTVANRIGQ